MKQFLLLSLIVFTANCYIYGQIQSDVKEKDTIVTSVDSAKAKKAISVALNYATLFSDGNDIEKIISLCSVPFIWLDTKIISNFNLLKQKHLEIISLKGKNRVFEVDTAYIKGIAQTYSKQSTPIDVYHVKFILKNPKVSTFVIIVQMSEIPRIMGLRD
jgi:hypothetical protein